VTLKVVWEPAAVDLATRFLADDPDGLRELFAAVDALAAEPRPLGVFPLGASGLYRLRVGRYRAVHETDDISQTRADPPTAIRQIPLVPRRFRPMYRSALSQAV
jgi:mRNA interferase RelE/StbE